MKKLFFYVGFSFFVGLGFICQDTSALPSSCNALDLAKDDKWKDALQCAHSQKNPTLLKLVLWSKYSDRSSDAKTEEILNFVTENPHFPDTTSLIATAEIKINDNTNSTFLKKWFSTHTPITDNGVKYYFYLMANKMDKKKHEEWIKKAWVNSHHDRKESKFFMAKFNKHLDHKDHLEKINHMIAIGHTRIDSALLSLLDKDHQLLINARLKIRQNKGSLSKNLEQVPAHLRSDSSLLYDQASFHEIKGQYTKIAELFSAHKDKTALKTDSWFRLRSRTAIELHQKGNDALAYKVSSAHNYNNPVNYVDAELFSGKLALFSLKDHNAALKHFKNVSERARFPATISKSAYWAGNSCLKLGLKTQATEYFTIAAKHLGTFYGQLANLKLNRKNVKIETANVEIYKTDLDWIKNNELVKASTLLARNSNFVLTKKFSNAAYTIATTSGKKQLLIKLGAEENLPNLSVGYGKIAEKDGFFSPEDYYPTMSIEPMGDSETVDPSLVLAVIRQESEFHTKATSSAGAMGLMQMLYSTAQDMSKSLGIQITKQSLYDPEINVEIGSCYLSKLLKRYNNNYILAIAAYNAGPVPVDRWIKMYGDPRKDIKSPQEAAEWIEKIPYYETRTYVQHVLSNVQMYRNILDHKEDQEPLRELHLDLTHDLAKSA